MVKTLPKQYLTIVYIINYHVRYMLNISNLKQDQKEKKGLKEYFINLDEKPKHYSKPCCPQVRKDTHVLCCLQNQDRIKEEK